MQINQLLPSIRFEVEKPYEEKLRRAKELIKIFGTLAKEKVVVSCSFGKDSMTVLHLAIQDFPNIAVIFNNTGVQYKETYVFKESIQKEWAFNLFETKPIKSFWAVAKRHGLPDGKKKSDMCCDYLKDIPFRRLVKQNGWTVCFTGLTAIESRGRMWNTCDRGQLYFSRKDNITKVHPIIYWTDDDVYRYHKDNDVPLNPAYVKYDLERLGCVPCTSHKYWRKQMAKTNPKMYKFIQEKFFHQRLLEVA